MLKGADEGLAVRPFERIECGGWASNECASKPLCAAGGGRTGSGSKNGPREGAVRRCRSRHEKDGEGEIRTRGRVPPTPVFKTGSLNRSDTSPRVDILRLATKQCQASGNRTPGVKGKTPFLTPGAGFLLDGDLPRVEQGGGIALGVEAEAAAFIRGELAGELRHGLAVQQHLHLGAGHVHAQRLPLL